MHSVFFLVLWLIAWVSVAQAEVWPTNSNVVNVKTQYGAVGNGVADDTTAILNAIKASVGLGHTIYFPNGTYKISNSLEWRNATGGWQANLMFEGESRASTIIKLADNATGFTSAGTPKAMISTGSTTNNLPNTTTGAGDEGFRNSFYDMTIDSGIGNAGAIGIDWMANNRCAIRNVTIKSSDPGYIGIAGIQANRAIPGPCLIQNVSIDGFNNGFVTTQSEVGITIDTLTLTNQLVFGINAGLQVLNINNLVSTNTVPVLSIPNSFGQVTMLNATLNGGSGVRGAIEVLNTVTRLYLRNIVTTGYQAIVKTGSTVVVPPPTIAEYVQHPAPQSLFPSPLRSLALTIESPPTPFYSSDFTNDWANVITYGANPLDALSDVTAIQAAMDSGKPIIYFPKGCAGGACAQNSGTYFFNTTVTIPATVKRIIGGEALFEPLTGFPANQPVFQFVGGSAADSTTIERWRGLNNGSLSLNGGVWIEDVSPRTVYLRDVLLGGDNTGFRTQAGAGKVFIDDIYMSGLTLDHSDPVWARQLDVETTHSIGILNSATRLWILGAKSEQDFTFLSTTDGGSSELVGGILKPGNVTGSNPVTHTGFLSTDSQISLIYTVAGSTNKDFPIHVQETRNGVTRQLLHAQVNQTTQPGVTRAYMGLFAGYLDPAACVP